MTVAPDDKPEPQPEAPREQPHEPETRGPVEELEYLEAEAQVNPNFRLWITIGIVVVGIVVLIWIILTAL